MRTAMLEIRRMDYYKGHRSIYPYRVLNEHGRIVKAFSSRKEAEDYISACSIAVNADGS